MRRWPMARIAGVGASDLLRTVLGFRAARLGTAGDRQGQNAGIPNIITTAIIY